MDNKHRERTRRSLAVWAAALLSCGWLTAHDFWIEPASFTPEEGEPVAIRLFVGDHFRGEPFARYASLIERFVVSGPDGEAEALGLEGAEPAGLARLQRPGLYTVGYRSKPSFTELDGFRFEDYLAEEGLAQISRLRSQRNETDAVAREAFSRCAKALIQVGEPATDDAFAQLGFELELTPLDNPYRLALGQSLPVRLTYRGQPLAGALVSALNQGGVSNRQAKRTDENGEASFELDRSGLWMIRTVHMIEATPELDADWESLWASLTFRLPAEGAEP